MTAAACAVADGLIAHPLTSRRVAQEQPGPRVAAAARPGFELPGSRRPLARGGARWRLNQLAG